jgi:hypothetical protein
VKVESNLSQKQRITDCRVGIGEKQKKKALPLIAKDFVYIHFLASGTLYRQGKQERC